MRTERDKNYETVGAVVGRGVEWRRWKADSWSSPGEETGEWQYVIKVKSNELSFTSVMNLKPSEIRGKDKVFY
jgi:hypothetical protein